MSGRHEGRTLAVQFLFQRDFNTGDLREALADFWLEHKAGPKVQKFAEELICGVERERDIAGSPVDALRGELGCQTHGRRGSQCHAAGVV
jgi:hypothetical protein